MDSFTLSVVGLVDWPGTAFSVRPFFVPEITLIFPPLFLLASIEYCLMTKIQHYLTISTPHGTMH